MGGAPVLQHARIDGGRADVMPARFCMFLKISLQIQKLDSSVGIIACFETLCGIRSVKQLLDILPTVCFSDAAFVDRSCDWSSAKHWAQWSARCDHLKMLSKHFL